MGDVNAHSWIRGYKTNNHPSDVVEDLIYSEQCDFVDNVQKQPTFLPNKGDQTHPDIVLCHPSLTRKIKHDLISPPGGGGHKILIIEAESRTLRTEHREFRFPRWNLKRARWEDYRRDTKIMIKEDILGSYVDQIAQTLTKIILKCALRNIPRGKVRKFKPYWNIELEKLKKGKDEARCRAERTGLRSDMVVLRKTSAQLRHAVICSKRQTYNNFLKEMDFRKDGKKAHAFISRINGEKIIEYEPIKIGNKLVTTEKDIAEVFCKNYCKISNVTIPEKIKNQDLLENPGCLNLDNSMLFCSPFSKLKLDVALSKLKMGKSAGPDGLLPEFLKNLREKAKDILLKFINFTWKSYVPAEWKKAEVLPILKMKTC
ncbi:uncharacterized protein [Halyomorpha halys]|uniref:uncharacterized protein n=1 Tax=Halyomorpha halys TaxID=286706 RepID=UPI0006D4CF0D|nr:uncharacterized protein LOC106690688 [Halyomorpha halys]